MDMEKIYLREDAGDILFELHKDSADMIIDLLEEMELDFSVCYTMDEVEKNGGYSELIQCYKLEEHDSPLTSSYVAIAYDGRSVPYGILLTTENEFAAWNVISDTIENSGYSTQFVLYKA